MGIEHVITCDECSRVLKDEDYTTVEIRIETDFNRIDRIDQHEKIFKLYCLDCAKLVVEKIKAVTKANG